MNLGWIDFSKTERGKVLGVLDLLQEGGTLDELGIAPIRDGFSNLFFPGTSTIQTRAKYFLIVPYALKDLEFAGVLPPQGYRELLKQTERECAERFLAKNKYDDGIIGGIALQHGRWVKRAPSEIYWAGLRQYRIFNLGNWTLTECLRTIHRQNSRKANLQELRSKDDGRERQDWDDPDAGSTAKLHLWNLPTYRRDWKNNLEMGLTPTEAAFLKEQIISTHPDSMLGFLLRENLWQVLDCGDFAGLGEYMELFPEHIRQDYRLAQEFSKFLYGIRVVYNRLASNDKNEAAVREYDKIQSEFQQDARLDLNAVFSRMGINGNVSLRGFLYTAQRCVLRQDYEGLCKCIREREALLKGTARAKTAHPGTFDTKAWFGGGYLDYRFSSAKRIIRDIMEGEMMEDAEP